jgi:hypothetical protein
VKEVWIIWTRYPGGRWRPTTRADLPENLLKTIMSWFGDSIEQVILPEGQEPEDGTWARGTIERGG